MQLWLVMHFFLFQIVLKLLFKNGISSVIQPGGSIKDQLSIDFCNSNSMSMVMTEIGTLSINLLTLNNYLIYEFFRFLD